MGSRSAAVYLDVIRANNPYIFYFDAFYAYFVFVLDVNEFCYLEHAVDLVLAGGLHTMIV